MEEQVILDFCGSCGYLLPNGRWKKPKCPNCGADLSQREFRIQGTFEKKEAERLQNAG